MRNAARFLIFGVIGAVLALLVAFFLAEPDGIPTADTTAPARTIHEAAVPTSEGALVNRTVVGIMWQGIVATPFRGKRVELSAFARPRIATAGHFFVRTQASGPLELLLSDQKEPRARGINQYVPRDADWAPYRVVNDVPLDAEVMYYGFALYGGGDSWIDDVRISIVDETAAVTSSGSVVGNQNIAVDPSWILPAPLNLDFELTSDGPTGGGEALHLSCAPESHTPTR